MSAGEGAEGGASESAARGGAAAGGSEAGEVLQPSVVKVTTHSTSLSFGFFASQIGDRINNKETHLSRKDEL